MDDQFLRSPAAKRHKVSHAVEPDKLGFRVQESRDFIKELTTEPQCKYDKKSSSNRRSINVTAKQNFKSKDSVVGNVREKKRKRSMWEGRETQKRKSRNPPKSAPTSRSPGIFSNTKENATPIQNLKKYAVPGFSALNSEAHALTLVELRRALTPTLETLCLEVESFLFAQGAGPDLLEEYKHRNKKILLCTDEDPLECYSRSKNSIKLSVIREKLYSYQYQDPWQYIEDVWVMFDNTWFYNIKTSLEYQCAIKLAKLFEQEVDPLMRSLGYCCGRRYLFNPRELRCYGNDLCSIPIHATYWSYQSSYDRNKEQFRFRYTYCQKCFSEIPGDAVPLPDCQSQPGIVVRKNQFVEMTNDQTEKEPFVKCKECERKFHKICVLHLDAIWPEGFTCDTCLNTNGFNRRKENKFRAENLIQTKLGGFIESRVNSFLRMIDDGSGEVTILVVSSAKRLFQVKPGTKRRYVDTGEWPESFPYHAKVLLAFQEIDGVDVCIFGLNVHEYGSDCAKPNTRRVYIAHLDGQYFFQPVKFHADIYREILLGYLEYVKQSGYAMAHISTAPLRDDLHCVPHSHPVEQATESSRRSQGLYENVVAKGLWDKIVLAYKDIMKQAEDDNLSDACELPYFDGDFWPEFLETCMKDLEKETDACEMNDGSGKRKNRPGKHSQEAENNCRNDKVTHSSRNLAMKVYSFLQNHKDTFSVIQLHSAEDRAKLPETKDPDPLINCHMLDSTNALLNLRREKHYEFSSLRRAKYFSMGLLHQLHSHHKKPYLVPSVRYRIRQRLIKVAVEGLVHARICREVKCPFPQCNKLKSLLQHVTSCKQTFKGSCRTCKTYVILVEYHVKLCQEEKCPIECCSYVKQFQPQKGQLH